MSYKCISIPTSRLSDEWLINNKFNLNDDIDTFITYSVATDIYDHYNFVATAHEEFICNTQEEFEQRVTEAKLERLL